MSLSIRVDIIRSNLEEHIQVLQGISDSQINLLEKIYSQVRTALIGGSTVFLCGNGGSAADSQHIAAELVGRFKVNRKPFSAVALTTDTSILTAIGNDFGYSEVFSRQVEAHGKPGDMLLAFSTSGNSENIVKAVQTAKKLGLVTVGFSGGAPSLLEKEATMTVSIPSTDTARIQECHILLGHIMCAFVEQPFLQGKIEHDHV